MPHCIYHAILHVLSLIEVSNFSDPLISMIGTGSGNGQSELLPVCLCPHMLLPCNSAPGTPGELLSPCHCTTHDEQGMLPSFREVSMFKKVHLGIKVDPLARTPIGEDTHIFFQHLKSVPFQSLFSPVRCVYS